MPRSFIIRTAIALALIIILLSAAPISDAASPTEGPLNISDGRLHLATANDLQLMISTIGVRDPSVNYNHLVEGMGTGLAPPTLQEWETVMGTALLDSGADHYDVPAASSLDLSIDPYFPQVRSQGSEGSCAAFALTYYNYGYIEARDQGWTLAKTGNDSQLLSPSWTYNKVNGASHEGSSFQENARIIKQLGSATWTTYPYVASDDEGLGSEAAWRTAPSHRISSYVSAYNPSPLTVVDMIKEQLGLHRPVNFALDASQYQSAFADNYIMSAAEYSSTAYNHGQTIVGYDDGVTDDGDAGAFKVVNSWGSSWGQGGYYYLTYEAIKEMLGYPLVYLVDLEDHQPSMLATWEFSTAPSVDASLEVGAGQSSSPSDKVSTYLGTGSSNRMCTFMAMDVSALYDEYQGGAQNFYLKVGSAVSGGTVSSFRLELYSSTYVPGSPTGIAAQSSEVPKGVPGVVNAGLVDQDLTPPSSQVEALPAYHNVSSFTVWCVHSDAGGSGVAHWELFYRYNAQGAYLRYCPASNPSGEWSSSSITFDPAQASGQGPYQFYSVAVDGAGNRESVPSTPDASTTVDTGLPVSTLSLSGTEGEGGWYISSVAATLSATDVWSGIQRIEYRLDAGTWTTYSSALSLGEGRHLLEYRSLDRAGNWEAVRSASLNVDLSAPIITTHVDASATNGWYRSPVTVTLSVTDGLDDDCTIQYRLDAGAWIAYSSPVTVSTDGWHTLEYKAMDEAGHLVQGSMGLNIDPSPPQSQYSLLGTLGEQGCYVSTVQANLDATDALSGVQDIRYRLNGGSWGVYSGSFQISEDGSHLLEYYATDRAGNAEGVRSVTILMDTHAPQVSVQVNATATNGWYRDPVTVTLSAMDGQGGDCSFRYRLNGGSWSPYQGGVTVSEDGQNLLEYQATDGAGNLAQGSLEVDLDSIAPQVQCSLAGEIGEEGRYVSAIQVTLSTSDQGSGVQETWYRLDEGSWSLYSMPFSIDDDGIHQLEYFALDQAGNQGDSFVVQLFKDSQGPSVQLDTDRERSAYGWFDGPVTVTLTSVDHFDQGCPVRYRIQGGEWCDYTAPLVMGAEGAFLLEYYATDLTGNQGEVGSREICIDGTAPLCSADVTGGIGLQGHYISQVIISLQPSDQGSGVDAVRYRLNGGEWATYSVPFNISAQGANGLEYYALDRAGNQGETMSLSILIDTLAPDVTAVTDREAVNGWFGSPVGVVLSSEEGCNVSYRVDEGPWETYGGPLTMEREGLNLLDWYGTDQAGNVGPVQRMELLLDLTAPVCLPDLRGEEGSNGYFVSVVQLELNVTDQGSGPLAIFHRLDGGDWSEYATTLAIVSEGDHTLEFYATDRAGNEGAIGSLVLSIDTSAPEIVITVLKGAQEDGTYLNHAPLRFTVNEEGSGVSLALYRLDGGEWLALVEEMLVEDEGSHIIECRVEDAAGHRTTANLSLEISLPLASPQAVQGLTASMSEEGILLEWSPSVTGLEARYLVYRAVNGIEGLLANLTGTSYLDRDVVPGEEYDYRVVPQNAIGEGPAMELIGLALPQDTEDPPYLLIIIGCLTVMAAATLIIRRR